ncbi:protein F37C4.5-like isoform X1 [Haliotis rufescens]|uniref:protein F37C4.5-like isoform X1 n=1 Tax=Haliotis rufescens TaxID=6454 RepID=UPI00201FA9BE|nr:protein F37C4.5-like isoform X1 [Haliotis rufescens]
MADEKSDKTGENVFLSPECPVEKVTVYSDRAEVCRQIHTTVVKGVNEIVLKQLPASIDSDSIRVEGTGQATIAEVTFQRKHTTPDEADISSKEKELEIQIADLKKEKDHIVANQNVMTKQWKLLENFGNTVSKSTKNKSTNLDTAYFQGVTDFLQLYRDEGGKLETTRLELAEQIAKLDEKINAAASNLSGLRANRGHQTESRECTIVLESEGEHKVSLLVSYVVLQASWTPSYDLRMFTAEGVLKIMYYGQITQITGEDWMDAKLFLSTASPSVGGSVPQLGTAVLSIQHLRSFNYRSRSLRKKTGSFSLKSAPMAALSLEEAGFADYGSDDLCMALPSPMSYVETKVNESATSTSYEIARQSTIPSDNMPHKVSVGIFDVKPKLEYITLPKVEPRAYLQAKVTNNSMFTLLPGATSIFLDNSFVAKAEIKLVSPGEEFLCSLGVDPAVRVMYKPLKKFMGSSGLISKSTTTTFEQVVEIKNTHEYTIDIVLKLQLPRSSDEKIKVALLEPCLDMKHPEKNTNPHITKQNHIVWKLNLDKQVSREITLKYTVDHPQQLQTQFTETFENE